VASKVLYKYSPGGAEGTQNTGVAGSILGDTHLTPMNQRSFKTVIVWIQFMWQSCISADQRPLIGVRLT